MSWDQKLLLYWKKKSSPFLNNKSVVIFGNSVLLMKKLRATECILFYVSLKTMPKLDTLEKKQEKSGGKKHHF